MEEDQFGNGEEKMLGEVVWQNQTFVCCTQTEGP